MPLPSPCTLSLFPLPSLLGNAPVLLFSRLEDSPGVADCLSPDGWCGAWSFLAPIDVTEGFLELLGLCGGDLGGDGAVGADGRKSGDCGALLEGLGGIVPYVQYDVLRYSPAADNEHPFVIDIWAGYLINQCICSSAHEVWVQESKRESKRFIIMSLCSSDRSAVCHLTFPSLKKTAVYGIAATGGLLPCRS
jgi:hypothetical protein